MVRVIFMLIRALRRKWLRRDVMARDHSGYGLGQWGKALQSNASFWYCIVRPAFNDWAHVQEWPLLKIVNDDALNPQVLHIISDAIIGAVLSQITSLAIVYSTVYSGTDKKKSKLHVTGLCAGNSTVTDLFPAQLASSAEIISIWWRHRIHLESRLIDCTVYTRVQLRSS